MVQMGGETLTYRQPTHYLLCDRIGAGCDLLRRLVLNWMLHINGIKAWPAESAGLNTRRSGELRGGHRHCGNA